MLPTNFDPRLLRGVLSDPAIIGAPQKLLTTATAAIQLVFTSHTEGIYEHDKANYKEH